jgi:8-oxo-dGTP pyrophosphatase MutT (NUDIX family)
MKKFVVDQTLSLVFIFQKRDGEYKMLLGKKNKPGKAIDGRYNGLGGKSQENETTVDCAVREVEEEARIKISKERLVKVGKILNQNLLVDVFIYKVEDDEFLNPESSAEQDMQNFSWFSEGEVSALKYEDKTIQGNDIVYTGAWENFLRILNNQPIKEFELDKSVNEAGRIFRNSMK